MDFQSGGKYLDLLRLTSGCTAGSRCPNGSGELKETERVFTTEAGFVNRAIPSRFPNPNNETES